MTSMLLTCVQLAGGAAWCPESLLCVNAESIQYWQPALELVQVSDNALAARAV